MALSSERDVAASALSHGDRRLLEVAVAMATRPRLLFLDEPTAGMNPVERARLLATIRTLPREKRAPFVVGEHAMAGVCARSQRGGVLPRGEPLCGGPPARVRGDARVREVYLGDEVSEPAGAGGAAP